MGGNSSSSRPEAQAAAIALMSSRKWWEFVKGGPQGPGIPERVKGQPASSSHSRGAARAGAILRTLPSGTQNKLPQGPEARRGAGLKGGATWGKGRLRL